MAGKRDRHIFAADLSHKLAARDITIKTDLVILNFGLARANLSIGGRWNGGWQPGSGDGRGRNFASSLCQSCANLIRIQMNFGGRLLGLPGLIELLQLLLERFGFGGS